jgi:sugar/nucleoside kinase (ribokinase family)
MGDVICTLGDLLLDIVVRLDGPIAGDTDTYGRTRVGPGGQAANVAAWVAELGGSSRFLGKRARDPAGRMLAEELARRGVEVAGPEVEAGTGTVVSLAAPDGTRTMLSDRGVSPDFAPDELEAAWLAGCTVLHLPAYTLVRSPIDGTALAAARIVRGTGARVSLDLSSVSAIRAYGVEAFRDRLAELAPELVFGNEEEVALAGPLGADTVVEKRGAAGCVVREGGEETAYPAEPAEVVDTTGAGDALAAGFLVGGPELGLAAAARCVARMGAFPA